jgi:EAL domain-containing protein (putative c-di-GMP-specific phosphodiesterase class I)
MPADPDRFLGCWSGYSSLSSLRRLPVSSIKIDRSFIRDMLTEPDDLAITVSVIDLARSVHLTTIAEGVETVEQLMMLRRLGCEAGQGFLWSPAVPPERLIAMVRADPSGRIQARGIEATGPSPREAA